MSQTSEGSETREAGATGGERRTNLELRGLVNEMLERLREMHRNSQLWNATERARAEQDLEMIMARVRRETVRLAHEEQKGSVL